MAAPSTELISAVFNDVINDDGYPFDNIFTKTPLVNYLLAKDSMDGGTLSANGRVRTYPGGPKIEVILEYGEGDSLQFYDGWDVITFTPQETIMSAFYRPTSAVGKLILLNNDIIDAEGDRKKVANLVKSKLRNMNKTVVKGLNTALLATSPGAKDIFSIPTFVKVDPTTSVEVGEINQLTYSWWRNQTFTSSATTWLALMREIRHARNTLGYNQGGDVPDMLLVDQTVFEYIIAYADSKGTHTFINDQISKLMNMEVKNVEGMSVLWDTAVPESDSTHSAAYLLNTDYLQFQMHEKRKFKISDPITPIPTGDGFQDATAWTVNLRGQLTCSNRNKQGVLHTISQSITS